MIRRTMDPAFLNDVANHPEVRPWLGAPDVPVLDLAVLIGNPANIAIEGEHGGWVLTAMGGGVYEIHSLFRPEGRGKPFFAGAREMLRYVFTRTDATEILTKCPDDNGGARMAAAMVGFRERFSRADAWAPGVGISYQAFTIDDWFVRDAEALRLGQDFHNMLEREKVLTGSERDLHPDDPTHDRAAGAALLMIGAGDTGKGVSFYNRWAVFAGYQTIVALGAGLVDIRDAIVEVQGKEVRVLLCR